MESYSESLYHVEWCLCFLLEGLVFQVSYLVFFIHLGWFLYKAVDMSVSWPFLYVDFRFPWDQLLKMFSFLYHIFLKTLLNIKVLKLLCSCLDLLVLFHFLEYHIVFYYYGSVIYLETWIGGFSRILIFFQNSFDYLGVVLVLLKF